MDEKVYVLKFPPHAHFWVAGEWLVASEYGQLEVSSESILAEYAGILETDDEKEAEKKLYDFLRDHMFVLPEQVELYEDGYFYPRDWEPTEYGLRLIGTWLVPEDYEIRLGEKKMITQEPMEIGAELRVNLITTESITRNTRLMRQLKQSRGSSPRLGEHGDR